ncbi:MAG: DNA/RNA non-specific endonuclease [Flavobacterium sp.]|nr:MAG: DNA/RNA non-specific endonuclease [Flavobacterium sp.]
MNRRILYPLLLVLVLTGLYFAEAYIDKQNEEYPQTKTSPEEVNVFDDKYLPSSSTGVMVRHSYYTLSYSEKHEQAEWIAYELKKEHLAKAEFERPYFVQDRKIKTESAHWRNYKNSGYDRGHLCPAGDRRFDYNAYHETFLTSNISPQDHVFNAGIWNRLEQKVRYWAERKDELYIITGGVLKDGLETIGDEEVSVPEEFYKIVIDKNGDTLKAIAFLIPNEGTSASFYDFTVSIDAIEKKTGLDFLRGLEDSMEDKLESKVDRIGW